MTRLTCIVLVLLYAASAYAQDFALERLNDSPRHHEWVEIEAGGRTVHSFVAYPQRSDPTLVAIVIHENRGLSDWVRSFADQLAEKGYVAVAPDLLSGFSAEYDRTSAFPTSDAARDALYQLDPDQITRDLQAVQAYAQGITSGNGKTVVMGFCWGGSQSFRFATNSSDLSAAMVFYGSPPDEASLPRITVPVYGFYGENDERINATIPATDSLMRAQEKAYQFEIYEGAGHAFMRSGDDPEGSTENRRARDASWSRLVGILSNL